MGGWGKNVVLRGDFLEFGEFLGGSLEKMREIMYNIPDFYDTCREKPGRRLLRGIRRTAQRECNMRKKHALIWLLLLLSAALPGCTADKAETPLPQLTIGYNEYRPYSYTDEDGNPAGIDIELAQEACRRMGYAPVFTQINWHDRDALLEDGKVDCLWSCYPIMGREDRYAWVGPYMRSRLVVAVLQDSPIRTLSDLGGRGIAVRSAGTAEEILTEKADPRIPRLERIYCLTDMENVAAALRSGYVDACAGLAQTLSELLQNSGVGYRFLEEELERADLAVAFRTGSDPQLRMALEAALNAMHRDGTTARILRNHGLNSTDALGGIDIA